VRLGKINCIESFIFEGPYVQIFISLLAFSATVRKSSKLTSRISPQERSKTSKQQILIRSKLHWLVHPLYFYAEYLFDSLSAVLRLFFYFYLVDLSPYPLKRRESPPHRTSILVQAFGIINDGTKPPCILVPHGSPHAASTTAFCHHDGAGP